MNEANRDRDDSLNLVLYFLSHKQTNQMSGCTTYYLRSQLASAKMAISHQFVSQKETKIKNDE